ncbi:DNA segregation ATPase FtsK/SpoIIIE, S-DNA-T family [Carnobacterium iners]|uniref:DNA translocase FtsK n=1 Tax=Carnobacterium iners TaxID=1073423 RepID=A0A1X7NR08_9LACT|nr:DNA translocase FtsK [Carnobacterium iners]SEK25690.1 DNA segregation ATPase FtsK/SpoIIIE, S-DNA-T family [Carnobacterium iners]SMH40489.1 DNA segregation ATPase FtsK/SpoIIIE, S-DNA-T family [Carnobacterium iners]
MATKKKKSNKNTFSIEIIGIIFILLSLLATSQLGFIGVLSANLFRFFVGNTFIFAALLIGIYGGYLVLKGAEPPFKNKRVIGMGTAYASTLLLLHAQLFAPIMDTNVSVVSASIRFFIIDMTKNEISQSLGGGMIGGILYSVSYFLFSQLGSYLLVVLLWFISIFLIFDLSFKKFMKIIRTYLKQGIGYLHIGFKKIKLFIADWWQNLKKNKKHLSEKKQDDSTDKKVRYSDKKHKDTKKNKTDLLNQVNSLKINNYQNQEEEAQMQKKVELKEESSNNQDLKFEIKPESENIDYQLPPTSLLDEVKKTDQTNEYALIQRNVKKLEETFKSFGVAAKVTKANLGPAVTKYEIQPAVGVKVSKIVSLSDDIALALAAKDIRMEAPIPGKPFIGIEVPNSEVSLVAFRNVIEGQVKNIDKLLEVPLGRDISGNVTMADLTKMPHLLVAGSTGSGKSVCINGIITSLLMRAKPNEVKLMMIDPKMVELNVYNGIPHLLTPVVTNPKKAAQALQKVVSEMEQRYELFAASGQRNITGYNQFIIEKNLENGEGHPTLPFIVVVVDELADLMMVASNEVEDAIIRLAQMARAAGIHMILATQRPSVDVITGIIKANVPSRIAFAVSSGTDSRTIIDSSGAEKLLGRGDMLYLPMGENKPVRVQGAYISDEEVERVVNYVTQQQGANYVEEMMPVDEPETVSGEAQDDYYNDAVQMIIDMQTASISLLQRRFRIGYNRAARLIDEMEMRGIVGPSEGSKPRKVNITEFPGEPDEEKSDNR